MKKRNIKKRDGLAVLLLVGLIATNIVMATYIANIQAEMRSNDSNNAVTAQALAKQTQRLKECFEADLKPCE